MATRERYPFQAIDDTLTINIPREWTGSLTALLNGTPDGVLPVGFTAAMEVSADEVIWEAATFTKPDQTTTASLLQGGPSGSFDSRAYIKARLRCTAAGSGTCGARLEFRRGR